MENLNSHNSPESGFSLPLDTQVAKNITRKFSIRLVKDIETGRLIPYYFSTTRFIEDKHCEAIRGFIKQELMDIFTRLPDSSSFPDVLKMYIEMREYYLQNGSKEVSEEYRVS